MSTLQPFPPRLAVTCGLLWGAAVMLADTLTQPVGDLRPLEWIIFSICVALQESAAGLVWTFGAKWAEASARPWPILGAALPLAWAASVLAHYPLLAGLPVMSSAMGRVVSGVPFLDIGFHLFWTDLFYGGLYVVGYFSMRRAMRLKRRLAELRLAHGQAEMRLREASLDAVHGQVQPATLLEALAALRVRYEQNPGAGDRLFDHLVAFLRAAMPGLRGGRSTLSGELALVTSYARLREDLDGAAGSWRLRPANLPIDPLFPAFRLLPALDRLHRSLRPGGAIEIATRRSDDDLAITARATGLAPTPDLEARLRRDLGAVFGIDIVFGAGLEGDFLMELHLPDGGHSTIFNG